MTKTEQMLDGEFDKDRADLLKRSDAIDYPSEVQLRMAKANIGTHPFPPIPMDLWDIIEAIVPGDPERPGSHEATVTLPMSLRVLELWGDVLSPNFSSVQVHKLPPETLLEVWWYAGAYLTYVREMYGWSRSNHKSLGDRQKFLLSGMTLHYGRMRAPGSSSGTVTAKIRDAHIVQDPAVVDANRAVGVSEGVTQHLAMYVKSLQDFVHMCSRFLTDHHSERRSTGDTGHRSMSPEERLKRGY